MSTIELKAPKRLKDLRFKHLEAYQMQPTTKGDYVDVKSVVKFVAAFLGVQPVVIHPLDYDDVMKFYNHCIKLFLGFGLQKPPKEINVNGVDYQLVNLDRPPVGFIADVDCSDFEADPVRLACICYIPKGSSYGDVDKNDNLLHPIASRYDDFKQHFPLEVYLYLSGFFLQKFVKSANKYTAIMRVRRRVKRLFRKKTRGTKSLT